MKKEKAKLKLGTRTATGWIGTCPVCHGAGNVIVHLDNDKRYLTLAIEHDKRTCTTSARELNVSEAALLRGSRPVTIYAAVARGNLKATRQAGWPIMFTPADFAAWWNRPDGRAAHAETEVMEVKTTK
jgi:hypothetical protein